MIASSSAADVVCVQQIAPCGASVVRPAQPSMFDERGEGRACADRACDYGAERDPVAEVGVGVIFAS